MSTQKIAILLISFLWIADATSQSRRSIIRSIGEAKVETLNTASYEVKSEDMRNNLKSYFKALGYALETEDDSIIRFSTQVTYVAEKRRYVSKYYLSSRRGSYYRTYCTKAFVDIAIIDLDSALQLNIYPNIDTRASTYKNPHPSNAILKFQELRLREHLYMSYYGHQMQVPDAIMADVDRYNVTQTKDRRKILAGRDY